MSDLARKVSAWKQSIRRAGTFTEHDVAELESHLIDSVDDLTRRGLTDDEAMLVALHRIGDPTVLAVEYQKVNPGLAWARRWYWMTAGFLGFSLALGGIRLLSHLGGWLTVPTGRPDAGLLAVGLAGLVALGAGILQSARTPGGRLARALQTAASWTERHPVTVAQVGFFALGALTIVNGMATSFVWRAVGSESLFAISTLDALAATAAPIGLFLLGRHLNRGTDAEVPAR